MQKRHNSSAYALELSLFCIKPSLYVQVYCSNEVMNQTLICPSMGALDRIWILNHHHYPLDFMRIMSNAWCHQYNTWMNVDLSSNMFCGIHLRAILQEVLMKIICKMCYEIKLLKLLTHLPGVNELRQCIHMKYVIIMQWSNTMLNP